MRNQAAVLALQIFAKPYMRVKSTAALIFHSFITCFLNIKKVALRDLF